MDVIPWLTYTWLESSREFVEAKKKKINMNCWKTIQEALNAVPFERYLRLINSKSM